MKHLVVRRYRYYLPENEGGFRDFTVRLELRDYMMRARPQLFYDYVVKDQGRVVADEAFLVQEDVVDA